MKNDWINEPLTTEEESYTGTTKNFTKSGRREQRSWYYSNAGHSHKAVKGANIPVEQTYEDQEAAYKRYYDNYGSDRFK